MTTQWLHMPTAAQRRFLLADEFSVLYGGAVGGGKSDALLMLASLYVDRSDWRALILREAYADLAAVGGLIDRAKAWWTGVAEYNAQTHSWRWPSGARIAFGHLGDERALNAYQGGEYHAIMVDEAGQVKPNLIQWLYSRLRASRTSNAPLVGMRLASNPGGPSHDWLYERFMEPGLEGHRFIAAGLDDNPHLETDRYEDSLRLLDDVHYRMYRYGDWTVRPSGGFFDVSRLQVIDSPELHYERKVRAWDLAATEGGGDWTVGVLMGRIGERLDVLDVRRFQYDAGRVVQSIADTARGDGQDVAVVIEQQPGAGGRFVSRQIANTLLGYVVYAIPPQQTKAERARPMASAIVNGFVSLAPGGWRKPFIDELRAFSEDPKVYAHDDQVDAAALAFRELATGLRVELLKPYW